MKQRNLKLMDHPCLFCGVNMKAEIHDRDIYHECDCDDAVLKREIQDEIHELQMRLPDEKFRTGSQRIIYNIDE